MSNWDWTGWNDFSDADNYILDDKEIDILQQDWDILIVLDECRYDYFKEIYKDILDNGELKKAISHSTLTREWVNKCFRKKDCSDIIYINTIVSFDMMVKGEHNFFKIVPVWETDWDFDYGTVLPDAVTKSALEWLKRHSNKRMIVHYIQPHEPCVYYGGGVDGALQKKLTGKHEFPIRINIQKIARKYFSEETMWKLGNLFGALPKRGKGAMFIKYGREGIIKGYKEDIKLALREAKKIVDKYPNKNIVIMADHGIRLGEHKNYTHGQPVEPVVVEVPWLEINNGTK